MITFPYIPMKDHFRACWSMQWYLILAFTLTAWLHVLCFGWRVPCRFSTSHVDPLFLTPDKPSLRGHLGYSYYNLFLLVPILCVSLFLENLMPWRSFPEITSIIVNRTLVELCIHFVLYSSYLYESFICTSGVTWCTQSTARDRPALESIRL